MKMRAGVLACAAFVAAAALAQPEPQAPPKQEQPGRAPEGGRQPGQPDGRQGRGGGEITNVESAMKLINRSVRRLKNQIADPEKKEENLKLVGDIERGIVAAKGMGLPERRPGGPGPRGGGRGEGGGQGPGGGEGGGRGGEHNGVVTPGEIEQPQGTPPARGDAPKGEAPKGEAPRRGEPLDRAKASEEYRRDLVRLLRQVLDVEQDLMDSKFEQAQTELGKIPQMRDDAHRALGVKEERD
jgi:hypothetical protein